jgi:glutamine synthetase
MYARPSGKLVPANHLDDLFTEGAGFAGFAAGEIGQGPHSTDMMAIPDPNSFTPLPWQPDLARFACDIRVEGEEWPYDPRTILKRQLAKAKAKGYVFKIGAECEFFLLRQVDGKVEIADALDNADRPCYDMRPLTRQYDFISTLSKYESKLGWDNYANDHEDANGQFESNFVYSDALTTSDRVIFFRYMVHTLAQRQGLLATFMPKPFTNLTGNGMHLHMSLWDADTDQNLFEDSKDPRGLGLSQLAYQFLGGLLKHAGARSFRGPDGRWRDQPIPHRDRDPGGRPRRHREQARSWRAEPLEHVRGPDRGVEAAPHRPAAVQPAGCHAPPGAR